MTSGGGKRGAIYFVLVTIFIDAMSFGLANPVLPRLIMDIGQVDISHAIALTGAMTVALASLQFVMGPVLGNLSDRVGRRPILLIALVGLAANYMLMSIADSIALLFVGQMLAGIFGGTIGTCQAAIADLTAKEDRAHNFGLIGAAFGLGFIVGPALGGLLGEFGQRMPFIAAALLTFFSFAFGYFKFPDTLKPEDRRPFDWRRANPLGALKSMRSMPGMAPAILVIMLWNIAGAVYPLTWAYYGIARFNWSNGMIGLSLAIVGFVTAISQAFITGRFVRRYGERRAVIIGMVAGIATHLGYAFATESWVAFVLLLGFIPQSLVGPALLAIVSGRAAADRQGEVQGMAAMAQGIGGIVAPLLITPAMSYFTSPAAPFQFAGAGFIVAVMFAIAAFVRFFMLPRRAATARLEPLPTVLH